MQTRSEKPHKSQIRDLAWDLAGFCRFRHARQGEGSKVHVHTRAREQGGSIVDAASATADPRLYIRILSHCSVGGS